MKRETPLLWRYRRTRARLRRFRRVYFPSPAEVAAARLMGAKTLSLRYIREPLNGYPLSFIIPAGWYKGNYIEREVRVGRGKKQASLDFANRRLRRGIEIDSRTYHDIVDDQEKDEWFASQGWRVLRIPAIYVNPRSKHYKGLQMLASIKKFIE